ncbi:hypothetical protein [Peterkaempfera bronchialis]|uniref:hypothetical protein n=1 Tax=Peterkaempfera bronchialis TaxID=2126346 RepID=UPI0013B3E26C|nr:hypothetical protein [Peterkaempfera bronchialis]
MRRFLTVVPILGCWIGFQHAARGGSGGATSAKTTGIGLFREEEAPGLVMPQGYKDSIGTWYAHLRTVSAQGRN